MKEGRKRARYTCSCGCHMEYDAWLVHVHSHTFNSKIQYAL